MDFERCLGAGTLSLPRLRSVLSGIEEHDARLLRVARNPHVEQILQFQGVGVSGEIVQYACEQVTTAQKIDNLRVCYAFSVAIKADADEAVSVVSREASQLKRNAARLVEASFRPVDVVGETRTTLSQELNRVKGERARAVDKVLGNVELEDADSAVAQRIMNDVVRNPVLAQKMK